MKKFLISIGFLALVSFLFLCLGKVKANPILKGMQILKFTSPALGEAFGVTRGGWCGSENAGMSSVTRVRNPSAE